MWQAKYHPWPTAVTSVTRLMSELQQRAAGSGSVNNARRNNARGHTQVEMRACECLSQQK